MYCKNPHKHIGLWSISHLFISLHQIPAWFIELTLVNGSEAEGYDDDEESEDNVDDG